MPTIRSASNTIVGRTSIAAEHRHRRAEHVAAPVEVALVDSSAEPRLEQHVDDVGRQLRQHLVDRRQRRVRRRVATKAQQQQVARAMRMERRLGVEHQLHVRRRRHLSVERRLGRHDVLHEVATMLRLVADGLAQPASDGQQRELADRVLVGRRGRRRGSRRQLADRQSTKQQRARLVCTVGEIDQRVVHDRRQRSSRMTCRPHEAVDAVRNRSGPATIATAGAVMAIGSA